MWKKRQIRNRILSSAFVVATHTTRLDIFQNSTLKLIETVFRNSHLQANQWFSYHCHKIVFKRPLKIQQMNQSQIKTANQCGHQRIGEKSSSLSYIEHICIKPLQLLWILFFYFHVIHHNTQKKKKKDKRGYQTNTISLSLSSHLHQKQFIKALII